MSTDTGVRSWFPPPARPVLVGVAVGACLGAGAALVFDVARALPVLFGVVAGVYAWALAAYPATRRLHFRTLDGRDRWLVAAFVLVVASQLALVDALDLRGGQGVLVSLTTVGSILAAATLGALIGERGGLEETDWP